MGKKANKPDLEADLARLETIAGKLESGEANLEASIELYEEGRKLGARCLEGLANLETRVKRVIENSDGTLRTEDFDGDQEE